VAGHGTAGRGQARHGKARRGSARPGAAWQGKEGTGFIPVPSLNFLRQGYYHENSKSKDRWC